MTFENKAKKIEYKTYGKNRKILSRQISFERVIAEELNKIREVVRIETGAQISSSFIVELALRYFFEYLENFDDAKALDIVVNGVFLKMED